MTTPLNNPSRNGSSPVGAVANVNALQDALSRLSSGAGGAPHGMGAEADFSRMVAQYRQAETASQTQAPASEVKPPMVAKANDSAARNLTQRLTDQALSKARMTAQLQQRQEQARAMSASPQAAQAAQADAGKSAARAPEKSSNASSNTERRGDARTDKSSNQSRAERVDDADDADQTAFNTAQGEGVAWVREINPPAGVDTSDPAGMMNWLAALTDGDASTAALTADSMELSGEGLGLSADQLAQQDAANLLGTASAGAQEGAWALTRLGGADAGASGAELSLDGMLAVDGSQKFELAEGLLDGNHHLGGRHPALSGLSGVGGALGDSFGARQASATLGPAPGSGQFAQAFADQVAVWVGSARADGPMTAELRLNPAEMGPINIKIAVDGQAARIDFAATALETRQAIESSLGQLSKALSDVGLSLSGGDVMSQFNQASGQGGAAGQRQGEGANASRPYQGDDESLVERSDSSSVRMTPSTRGGLGGLDLYA